LQVNNIVNKKIIILLKKVRQSMRS